MELLKCPLCVDQHDIVMQYVLMLHPVCAGFIPPFVSIYENELHRTVYIAADSKWPDDLLTRVLTSLAFHEIKIAVM